MSRDASNPSRVPTVLHHKHPGDSSILSVVLKSQQKNAASLKRQEIADAFVNILDFVGIIAISVLFFVAVFFFAIMQPPVS
jgi:hypothetical protein